MHETLAVPYNHKDCECNTDAEYLDDTVKKQVAVQSDDVQTGKDRQVTANNKYFLQRFYSHSLRSPNSVFTYSWCPTTSNDWCTIKLIIYSKGNTCRNQ